MNIYEGIKRFLKESDEDSYNKEVLEALNNANAKEEYEYGFDEFLLSVLNSEDYSKYCDYADEANSVRDVQYAIKDLKKIFTDRIKDRENKLKNAPKADDKIRKAISSINDDMIKFLKNKGATITPDDHGFDFDLSKNLSTLFKKYDKLLKSLSSKKEEYYNEKGSTNPKFTGSFSLFLAIDNMDDPTELEDGDANEIYLSYYLSLPSILQDYLGNNLNINTGYQSYTDNDGTHINDIKDAVEVFKRDIEAVLSLDATAYEQYLKDNIKVLDEKIQKRENKLKDKRSQIKSGSNSVVASKSDVINLLNEQVPNIPSNIYNPQYGNFRIKGLLPNGYTVSLTIRLLDGKTPGTFDYGLTNAKRNPEFIKHCTEEIAKALNATKTSDRKDIMSDSTLHCYTADLKNLNKLPGIITKLNSELKGV